MGLTFSESSGSVEMRKAWGLRHSHHSLWDSGNLSWHRTGDLLATFDAFHVLAIGSEWSQSKRRIWLPLRWLLMLETITNRPKHAKTKLKIEWTGCGKSYEVIRDHSRLFCWPARQFVSPISTINMFLPLSYMRIIPSAWFVCRSKPCHSYQLGE